MFAPIVFLSLFITLALLPAFRGFAGRARIVDIPNERKVHTKPMPKIGGLAMAVGFTVPVLLWLTLDRFVTALLAGAMILVAEGFADDVLVLGYRPKLLAQAFAALVVIFYGGVRISSLGFLAPGWEDLPLIVSLPLTLAAIVGITNAINLADGLDGLAGGIVLVSFLCVGFIARGVNDGTVLFLSLAMLGAIFGFLSFNTYPASIFMGDAGSQFIGFVSIVLSLKLTQGHAPLSPYLPLLITGLPLIDTVAVMSERMASGRSPFLADNSHIHHKLLGAGLCHTEAVFAIYVIQSAFVLGAYLLRFHGDGPILGVYLAIAAPPALFAHAVFTRGISFRRHGHVRAIKGTLRLLKDRSRILSVSSFVLHTILPMLLILNCLLVEEAPTPVSAASAILAGVIVFLWLRDAGMAQGVVRSVLYLLVPFVLYLARGQTGLPWGAGLDSALAAAYALCVVAAIVTVRLDRRRNTFRGSPMDFLVIVIALCALPVLGAVVDMDRPEKFLTQNLIFFYTYEIMLNERRPVKNVVTATTVGMLLIIAVKGVSL